MNLSAIFVFKYHHSAIWYAGYISAFVVYSVFFGNYGSSVIYPFYRAGVFDGGLLSIATDYAGGWIVDYAVNISAIFKCFKRIWRGVVDIAINRATIYKCADRAIILDSGDFAGDCAAVS